MSILRCKKAPFAGGVMLLVLLVYTFTLPLAAIADERNFPAGELKEKIVEEAIKFIKDNEGTNPTDADEDLTTMCDVNAPDKIKQLREETNWDLGTAATDRNRIRVGLPITPLIETDVTTAEGFRQVKTLAAILYHEWIHWKQKQQYNDDLTLASKQNWAACQPQWGEIDAYYKQIKLKLQWKLATEQLLEQVPGYGKVIGPPSTKQQEVAEQLQREIAQLERQIDEVLNDYLCGFRNIDDKVRKTYEGNVENQKPTKPSLKDAFQGKTNQQKYDEVVARLNDVSKIDPCEPKRTINEKIAAKVKEYRLKKWMEGSVTIPVGGGMACLYITEAPYLQLFEMTAQPGTFYAPTQVTVTCLSPDFMAPWKKMGYTILSPVYEVSAPIEAMANPAYPARVTLSYDTDLASSCEFHLYQMRAAEDNHDRPLWQVLPGESVDYGAGIISGDSNEPFSLYVVMEKKCVSGACSPRPADGAADVPLDTDLCWPKSEEAYSYDVYFGKDFKDVKYGRRGTFKGNQTARWYDPGTLEPCTTYYWKVEPLIEEEEGKPKPPWPPPPPPGVPSWTPYILDSSITIGDVRIYADIYLGDVWSFTTQDCGR